jgi:hypothetical protein
VNRQEYERNVGRRIHNTICAFDGVDHFPRGNSGFIRSKLPIHLFFIHCSFFFKVQFGPCCKDDTDDILFHMVVNLHVHP